MTIKPQASRIQRPELILMQGIPGLGKSTWARMMQRGSNQRRIAQQTAYELFSPTPPEPEIVVLSRDDLRMDLFDQYYGGSIDEQFIKRVQHNIVNLALVHHKTVIIDDTNLRPATIAVWMQIASSHRVKLRIKSMLSLDKPEQGQLALALKWNQRRDKIVPESEVRRMFDEFYSAENQQALAALGLDPSSYIN